MALTSGAGPHFAWLNVDGATIPILTGTVTQSAKRRTSRLICKVPLRYPRAYDALANLADNVVTATVLTRGMQGILFTGEAKQTKIDYIGRVIHVEAHDLSSRLHDNKTSEKWVNKMPSEIVQDLIGRVGLSGNVASSSLMAGKKLDQEYVKLSDNVSFAYVIHKLAELDGARYWVDVNGTFHYEPIGNPTGIYSVTINQDQQPISSDCLHLSVDRNVQAGKKIQVNVKAWHPRDKQVYQHTATVPGNGGPVVYNYHFPTLRQDHVQQYAISHANERARHELTVVATVVGDPSVSAGMGLSLSGTGFFDQTYDMDTVQHQFGKPGHTTHITARSAKQGRTAS